MNRSLVAFALLCGFAAYGAPPTELEDALTGAVAATGDDYVRARERLVGLGTNALPHLRQIAGETNHTWQSQLMAGIAIERLERPGDLRALINKKWENDPEFDAKWFRMRGGPMADMWPLLMKTYNRFGLWYYYIEVVWKETAEHWGPRRGREDDWRMASLMASTNSPRLDLLCRVLEDRIRKDPTFKDYETKLESYFLLNDCKTNTPLKFLLEIFPTLPVNNPQEVMRKMVYGKVQNAEDAVLVEKHFRDKGQDVPVEFRQYLENVKTAPKKPGTDAF